LDRHVAIGAYRFLLPVFAIDNGLALRRGDRNERQIAAKPAGIASETIGIDPAAIRRADKLVSRWLRIVSRTE